MALDSGFNHALAETVYGAALLGRFPNTDFRVDIHLHHTTLHFEVQTTIRKDGKGTHIIPVRQMVPEEKLYSEYQNIPIMPTEEVYATLMLLGAE